MHFEIQNLAKFESRYFSEFLTDLLPELYLRILLIRILRILLKMNALNLAFLPVSFRYRVTKSGSVFIDGVKHRQPDATVYLFPIDQSPIKKHPELNKVITKTKCVDLTIAPSEGFFSLNLSDDLLSKYYAVQTGRFHWGEAFLAPDLTTVRQSGSYKLSDNPAEFVVRFQKIHGKKPNVTQTNQLIQLLPSADRQTFVRQLIVQPKISDLLVFFVQFYQPLFFKQTAEIQSEKFDSSSSKSLTQFIEDKLQFYENALKIKCFKTQLGMLNYDLSPSTRDVVQASLPVDKSQLLTIARLFDENSAAEERESFRQQEDSNAQRLADFEDDLTIEEESFEDRDQFCEDQQEQDNAEPVADTEDDADRVAETTLQGKFLVLQIFFSS